MTPKMMVMENLSSSKRTREELVARTNLSDRAVRRAISELRYDGVPVCTDSKSGGYGIGTGADKEHTIREMRSRAYKLLAMASRMEKFNDGTQMMIGE